MAKILVVDDERNVRQAFEEILADQGHMVVAVRDAEDALSAIDGDSFDLAILDVCLPGMNGLDALARIKQRRPKLPVIVMTGQGTTNTAIEATKRGAFDYQLKPFEPEEMLQTIAKVLEGSRLMKGELVLGPESGASSTEAMVGRSPPMQQLYKAIGRVAQTDATVLIRGESGTGKELVARAIYQHSLRSGLPLMVVNCAAIPETLLESELFGYESGAFTGAATRRIGKFEQAHSGTIFLDEIGDMSLAVQAKILRLLQERTFQRLGGNETIQVDVRVLCATNRNLEKAIAQGGFREDLYHRLDVVTLQLPPLRDRRGDVPLLVDYFLNRCARTSRVERPPFAQDALDLLAQYDSECNSGLAGFVAGVSDLARIQEKLDPGRFACLAATTNCLLTHPMRFRSFLQDLHRANHFRRDFVDASSAGQELITIAVQPRCRGQGHGKALLHALIERARRDRVVQLRVSIDSNDQGMSYFFRKFGFIPIRTFKVLGGQWRDEYLLRISDK